MGCAAVGAPLRPQGPPFESAGCRSWPIFVPVGPILPSFALCFWALDSGGPVARALAERRTDPDFQFPQDDNPQLAPADWEPRLPDYAYLSFTNTLAFSPTDAMPLSHVAKLLMATESLVAVVTILLVAARAINILD